MKNIISVLGFTPVIAKDSYIAPSAMVIGDVILEEQTSVWFNSVIRGDVMPIRIGRGSNIQDNCVLHGTYQKFGCTLEDRVTLGHSVILHGCHIGRESLIGMGSIVMDGAVIGEQSLVGAGSLVTEGSKFPPRSLIIGRPAKVKRLLNEEEIKSLSQSADNYLLYKTWYEETPL